MFRLVLKLFTAPSRSVSKEFMASQSQHDSILLREGGHTQLKSRNERVSHKDWYKDVDNNIYDAVLAETRFPLIIKVIITSLSSVNMASIHL